MKDIRDTFSEIFTQRNIVFDALHWIGWILVKTLKFVCDTCEELVNSCYELLDFTDYSTVTDFIGKWDVVIAALLGVSLTFLGIMYILTDKRPKVVNNILIFIAICVLSTSFFSAMNKITETCRTWLNITNGTASNSTISRGIVDLLWMDSEGFDETHYAEEYRNYMGTTEKYIMMMKVNDTINPEEDGCNKELFGNYNYLEGGKILEEEIEDTWFGDPEYYYRYSVDFLTIFIGLVAYIFAFIGVSYKVCQLIYQLALQRFLAYVFAPLDITNGQKIRKLIETIISTYLTLILTTAILQFFSLFLSYVDSKDFNILVSVLIKIFIAMIIVDSPKVLEQILGIDAGLGSGIGAAKNIAGKAKGVASLPSKAKGALRGRKIGKEEYQNAKESGKQRKEMDKAQKAEKKAEKKADKQAKKDGSKASGDVNNSSSNAAQNSNDGSKGSFAGSSKDAANTGINNSNDKNSNNESQKDSNSNLDKSPKDKKENNHIPKEKKSKDALLGSNGKGGFDGKGVSTKGFDGHVSADRIEAFETDRKDAHHTYNDDYYKRSNKAILNGKEIDINSYGNMEERRSFFGKRRK